MLINIYLGAKHHSKDFFFVGPPRSARCNRKSRSFRSKGKKSFFIKIMGGNIEYVGHLNQQLLKKKEASNKLCSNVRSISNS